jgi:thiamine biosynthesis lipoprotein
VKEPVYRRTELSMGTLVTIDVVASLAAAEQQNSSFVEAAVERAFSWFDEIEHCCSRFDPQSELSRLSATVGVDGPVSAILFQAVQFALAIAHETRGAFDPTVGAVMETRGFDRNYLTGETVRSMSARGLRGSGDYRDVRLDSERKTITLLRPLLLDLGAVAKGLAIDMAAHELRPFANFAINAGGDIYVAGHNANREPWSVGIRHPRIPGALIDSLRVSDCAVCTSGDYERHCPEPNPGAVPAETSVARAALGSKAAPADPEPREHHILDPRLGRSPQTTASATVVAPTAMLADALATAAFVLGPSDGIALLERLNVDGLMFSPDLERHATSRYGARNGASDVSPATSEGVNVAPRPSARHLEPRVRVQARNAQ